MRIRPNTRVFGSGGLAALLALFQQIAYFVLVLRRRGHTRSHSELGS